jgi:hypothetical protein
MEYDTNTTIIKSKFNNAGEIMPFYYFYNLHPFEKAIIVHDSMIVQGLIDHDDQKNISFLWYFEPHVADDPDTYGTLFDHLNHPEELKILYKDHSKWKGCFGTTCAITWCTMKLLEDNYNFLNIVSVVRSRPMRMGLERVLAVVCFHAGLLSLDTCSLFGCIHKHPGAFRKFDVNHPLVKEYKCSMLKTWQSR